MMTLFLLVGSYRIHRIQLNPPSDLFGFLDIIYLATPLSIPVYTAAIAVLFVNEHEEI